MIEDKDQKIEAIRVKRTAATLELQELMNERKKAEKVLANIRHKMKAKTELIRNYSQAIGTLRDGIGHGKVTDHAIVRYLERYKGIDIEAVVNEILEHPDAKVAHNGMVSTIFDDRETMLQAKKMVKMAKLRKAIP